MIIVSLLLFAAGSTDYYIKRDQLFSNIAYVIAGLILTAFICVFIKIFSKHLNALLTKHQKTIIIATLLLFLALSIILCISGFFYSDWDPLAILYAVYEIKHGNAEAAANAYFSNHPNNLMLVWLYLTVVKMTSVLKVNAVLVLIVFQCIISSIAAFIFWRIVDEGLAGSKVVPYAGLLIYEIWIGLSPWFIITYSDEIGIIFPLLILRIYQKITYSYNNGRSKSGLMWFVLMSFIAGTGYFIKPQIIISYIAAVLFFLFRKGSKRKFRIKELVVYIGVCMISVVISGAIVKGMLIPSLGMELDNNRSFGMAHYFMMGLNGETDGVYSDEDTLFTDSFSSPEKKRNADMQKAAERIKGYGFVGLIEHAKKKTFVNYNDGLFAWGVDGKFFAGRESDELGNVKKMPLTDIVWSFIMPEGSDHGKYSSFLQIIWLTVLLLDTICAIVYGKRQFGRNRDIHRDGWYDRDEAYVVMLSLTGLFLFELLFEAKARYLFIYTPYYLILSVYGTYVVMSMISYKTGFYRGKE